jgi:hypothetical protein
MLSRPTLKFATLSLSHSSKRERKALRAKSYAEELSNFTLISAWLTPNGYWHFDGKYLQICKTRKLSLLAQNCAIPTVNTIVFGLVSSFGVMSGILITTSYPTPSLRIASVYHVSSKLPTTNPLSLWRTGVLFFGLDFEEIPPLRSE